MYGSRNSQTFSIIKNIYFKNIFTVFYCFISLMTVFEISKYSLILSQYCFVIFKFTFLLFLQWFLTVIWKHIFLERQFTKFCFTCLLTSYISSLWHVHSSMLHIFEYFSCGLKRALLHFNKIFVCYTS